MSGVIIDGVQWERCNGCGEYVEINSMHYEQPTESHKYGRDLCVECSAKSTKEIDTNPERITIKIK